MKYDISLENTSLTYINTYYHYEYENFGSWSSFQNEQLITDSIKKVLENMDKHNKTLDPIINSILSIDSDFKFNDITVFKDTSKIDLEFHDPTQQLIFDVYFEYDPYMVVTLTPCMEE